MGRGKSINLFLMDGIATGRIKCTLANWTGVAYKIPRTELDQCKERDDLKQSGVYFLFGVSDQAGDNIAYIGQAGARKNGEGILYRLQEHKRNPDKDYWTEAVVFTTSNNSFGPTEISYLENRFCKMALIANRYKIKNGNDPTPGNITEEKESELEEFIDYATVISDRLRKVEDNISEVETKVFSYEGETVAYLWYARTSFYGTLQDEAIKGLRVRKGNILIGDKTTLNHVFKDARFNGWLLGELHILSDRLIPNARRDEMEKNAAYSAMISELRIWADGISSEIRKISNQRSSDKKAQRIIEFAQNENTPDIESTTTVVMPEVTLIAKAETEQVNYTELVAALDTLIGAQRSSTKYKALNLQTNITIEQKKVLERVFDIICGDEEPQSNTLITKIIREFVPKSVTVL